MLYGQRVTLRPVVEEDWEKRYEWLSDPVVNRTLPSGSGMPLTPEVVRERTRKFAQTDLSAAYFTIIKEDGIPIGSTQLFNIHPWSKHAEFGIWIGNKMVWGRGYATEVTGVVLDLAFERLNLHKVYLTVDADNPGAIRSYEKAGFKKDGILRDEVYKNGQYVDRILMSILKHEFLKLSNCSKQQNVQDT